MNRERVIHTLDISRRFLIAVMAVGVVLVILDLIHHC